MTTQGHTAHSAVRFDEESPELGVNAGNARARENHDNPAVSQGQTAAETAPLRVTQRDRRPSWWRGWQPPEPWQLRSPSLAAKWRYARRGGWTGTDRLPPSEADSLASGGMRTRHRVMPISRIFGVWYFRLVVVPTSLVTTYLQWVLDRPGRAFTAAVLLGVAWMAVTR
jgi:hypothetical protein